ncbi:MAG: GNAT family N-acetyltransferase [Phycisphaerales bacterium]|nr:GNAT family N-acetyltransferase [Phycisphaerales bacterium]
MTAAPRAQTGPTPAIVRVTPALHLPAAAALVGRGRADALTTGQRFLEAAALHKIDLRNMWASVDPDGRSVRQVCLAVPGSGRTATMFTSTPGDEPQTAELASVVRAACGAIEGSALAQALLEPVEALAMDAFAQAGFERLADLAYLRRPTPSVSAARRMPEPVLPPGVHVRPLAPTDEAALPGVLDQTYIDTLDCPRLCELRTTDEVLESHRAAGRFDPTMWWMVDDVSGDAPRTEGVMLFNPCPAQGTIELVYLGLAPALRGRGLALPLLEFGVRQCALRAGSMRTITCAVDRANTPAIRLYERAGFRESALRVAYVLRTAGGA